MPRNRIAMLLALPIAAACGEPFVPAIPEDPPRVERMAPAAGTVGIARAAIITATFSEPARAGTVNEGSLRLFDGDVLVRADVRLAEDRLSATLTPRDLLAFGTEYTVVVSGTVLADDGRAFVGRSWTFETKRNKAE